MLVATRAAGLQMRRRAVPVIAHRAAFRITIKLHIQMTRVGIDLIGVAWKGVVNPGRYARTMHFSHSFRLTYAYQSINGLQYHLQM